MQYHQTDKNGFYIGTFDADASPAEPDIYDEAGTLIQAGAWLIPGGGVLDAPPVAGPNQAAQFFGGAWRLVGDFRGVVYWTADGVSHAVTERGQVPPDGAFDAVPLDADNVWQGGAFKPRVLTLDEVKAREVAQTNRAAQNRLDSVDRAVRRALVRVIEGAAVSPALLARIKKNDLIEDAWDAAIVAIEAAATKAAARAVFPAIVWP